MIIGISGISGAGKTALVKALSKKVNATALYWDDFDDISSAPSDYINWYNQGKDYTAFDYSALAHALTTLKSGVSYYHPVLKIELPPTHYLFADLPLGRIHKQTAKYVDQFFYIDTPLDVALARRIIRDYKTEDRDNLFKDLNDYVYKYRKLFMIDDVKKTADKILDGTLDINTLRDEVLKFGKLIEGK